MTGQGEGQVGERVALGAINSVLTVETLLGANLLVQELGKSGRKSNERSTSVKNNSSVVNLSSGVAESDGVKVDLPVSLAAERDLGHLAGVVVLVDTTEGSLRVVLATGSVAEVEGENGLIDQSLVDHVVEGRNDLVDRNAVVAETHDTVEAAEGEGQARL